MHLSRRGWRRTRVEGFEVRVGEVGGRDWGGGSDSDTGAMGLAGLGDRHSSAHSSSSSHSRHWSTDNYSPLIAIRQGGDFYKLGDK